MPKLNLTDRGIAALKPAPEGRRYEVMDSQVPGLGIRVTHAPKVAGLVRGQYIFVACFPGGKNPVRRTIGTLGGLTLAEAREKARGWRKLMDAGKDPAGENERQRRVEARQRAFTLEAVAEDFIREKLPGERKGAEVARDIRRDLLPALGAMPITEIERIDIRNLIRAKKETAPAQARNLLGYAKRLFSWAVAEEAYGLNASPCSEIKARDIIGDRPAADRILSDDEIFALWRASGRLGYPYGAIYRILLLAGLRLNEAADASRPEFDLRKREWTIPAARMKGKNGKARPHVVPLIDDIMSILEELPVFAGPFLFSFTAGEMPAWMNSKIKAKLDRRMLRTIQALARIRGEARDRATLEPWVNHDIRRTVRTNLSPLKNAQGARIADEVKEAVLAHARTGIRGVYDKYLYLDEKREALELWAAKLREIVQAPPSAALASNVVPYRKDRSDRS